MSFPYNGIVFQHQIFYSLICSRRAHSWFLTSWHMSNLQKIFFCFKPVFTRFTNSHFSVSFSKMSVIDLVTGVIFCSPSASNLFLQCSWKPPAGTSISWNILVSKSCSLGLWLESLLFRQCHIKLHSVFVILLYSFFVVSWIGFSALSLNSAAIFVLIFVFF